MEIKVDGLKCGRCGYKWFPRITKEMKPPKTCANKKCKSPYWNKPRVYKLKSLNQKMTEGRQHAPLTTSTSKKPSAKQEVGHE